MLNRIAKYSSALVLEEIGVSGLIGAGVGAKKEVYSNFDDDDESDNTNNDNYDYETTLGNLSYQRALLTCGGEGEGCFFCSSNSECSCPGDQHFLQRVVRWVKIIARSQQLMTVVFGIVPLLVGLAIGIYAGRKWEQRQQQKQQPHPRSSALLLSFCRCFQYVVLKIFWLRSLTTSLAFLAATALRSPTKQQTNVSTETKELPTIKRTNQQQPSEGLQEEEHLQLLRNPSHYRQSGVDPNLIPKHIAFIMDGNRRYGKQKYKSVSRGHADGGYKLRDMVHWCLEECVREMTVYAFSTENWNRSPTEIDALMAVFCHQCEELRKESVNLQIVVRVLSTDTDPIPAHVKEKLKQLEDDTRNCRGSLYLNVCLSYGSRGELVTACRSLAADCRDGKVEANDITEQQFESRLLTNRSPSPDVLLRTSGELRMSNFLLWQCAYSELFFLTKHWPELEKEDLLEVIRGFAHGRKRRFGV